VSSAAIALIAFNDKQAMSAAPSKSFFMMPLPISVQPQTQPTVPL
jgi:hypothetical protein